MALAKALIKSIALRTENPDPGAMLVRANAEVGRDNTESLFVTVFAGLLDTRTGNLAFCNAGHAAPLACAPEGAPEIVEHAGGPPLCVIEGFEYPSGHLTDGVTEAMNPNGEFYGTARLMELLERHRSEAPAAIIAAVAEDVRRFAGTAEQSDDLTLLCVRWNGAPGGGLAPKDDDLLDETIEITVR
jgi:serine phosphatase RsbU (regulator of sigma subunit)